MIDLTLIAARRAEIAESLREMEEQRSLLEAELKELDIATRVIARLSASQDTASIDVDDGHSRVRLVSMDDRGKPENAPTVPDMILWVLQQAKQNGLKGLEPKQMKPIIAERWWPNVPGETVNSIAWRMWKRHQISKEGPLYMLSD